MVTDKPLTEFKEMDFGLVMDNVASVLNLSALFKKKFLLYPNPVIKRFEESVKSYDNHVQALIIKVNWAIACKMSFEFSAWFTCACD